MLNYLCNTCGNTTALIKKDNEGDIVSECLACGHIEPLPASIQLSTELKGREHSWEPTDSQGYSMQCSACAETYSLYDEAERNVLATTCPGEIVKDM